MHAMGILQFRMRFLVRVSKNSEFKKNSPPSGSLCGGRGLFWLKSNTVGQRAWSQERAQWLKWYVNCLMFCMQIKNGVTAAHKMSVSIEVRRSEPDGLALSSAAIDEFRGEQFTLALKRAMLEAFDKGILPRSIRLNGVITVEGPVE